MLLKRRFSWTTFLRSANPLPHHWFAVCYLCRSSLSVSLIIRFFKWRRFGTLLNLHRIRPMKAAKILRRHASRFLRSAGFSLLRRTSEYRAYTELFVSPYSTKVDWCSGLGDAVFTLYGLVRAQHPEVIVEIGSARGRSTCALALACRKNGDGRVYAIDPHTVNPWADIGTGGKTEAFLRDRLRDYRLRGMVRGNSRNHSDSRRCSVRY